jgi:integrase
MSIKRRNKIFHLIKRVPKRYAAIETRKTVWISLHTDSESVARQKAPAAWGEMIEAWEARLAGDTEDAEKRFDAARELAQKRGYRFLSADKVAQLPRGEFLDRVRAVVDDQGEPDKIEAAAVLGGAQAPQVTVEKALELFWDLAKDKTLGKSDDQLRRWKNPRIKAVSNFVKVIGNKPLAEVSRDDMLDFRDWWFEKLAKDGLTANSANKDLVHLGNIWKTVNSMKRLGLALPLGGLSFKQDDKSQRLPFSSDWIRTRLLAEGAFDGLNTEARCIVLGMVNTGYRPSEAAGLLPEHIHLEGKVPFISIEPVGRQLKNKQSIRQIPLTGVSLDAFKECPNGFERYRESSSTLSGTVNKYLRANGLSETPDHTLYGLRHSLEDRMIAGGVDERIRRDIFGHALNRERYGKGATLEHKHKILQDIAF